MIEGEIEQNPEERQAALAAHDHFARYGPEPWAELRAAFPQPFTVDDLIHYFLAQKATALEAEAVDARAMADRAAAGDWTLEATPAAMEGLSGGEVIHG